VNADSGAILWRKKLGAEQRQSSPFFADGKLYIAFYIAGADPDATGGETGNGELYVFKPGEKGPEVLSRTRLVGRCFGSPIAYNGKLYVQTDRKLYAFGKKGENQGVTKVEWKHDEPNLAHGPATRLQLIPNEVLLRPGETKAVRARTIDANGFVIDATVPAKDVKMDAFVPPTALVKAKMNGHFDAEGKLTAGEEPVPSAGAYQGVLASNEKITGTMRGRVLPTLPMKFDFENFELKEMTGPGVGQAPVTPAAEPGKPAPSPGPTNWNVIEPPTPFAYPPLAWNAARFRFDVREAPKGGSDAPAGNKALCKTIDNKIFQRATIFIGHTDMKNYTIEADILSEGNKRKGADVGLINQRYLVSLKFNEQAIELSSNHERLKQQVPFKAERNVWYRMKVRVETAQDGSGIARAKVWKKGEAEPEAWAIEYTHKTAHPHGSPGIFCLTPQEQRAWIDNLEVKSN
jgi:hypothetical protein